MLRSHEDAVKRSYKKSMNRLNNNRPIKKALIWTLIVLFYFFCNPSSSKSMMEASNVYPHELAYKKAKYVVLARVISFDAQEGLYAEVTEVLRGTMESGGKYYLRRTSAFPFMNKPGTKVTLFLKSRNKNYADLWQGPTTGGVIWNDQKTVKLIEQAASDPEKSLLSIDKRESFAAAYYLSSLSNSSEFLNRIVRALIWGLAQNSQEINQAAIEAFYSLNIEIHPIIGPYHPGLKLELKNEIANKLSAWWDKRIQH